MNNPTDLIEINKDVIQKISKSMLIDADTIVVDTEKSHGPWLVDSQTGRNYLDCFSQFASQPLGWNHPKVNAMTQHLGKVALHKIANSDMATEIMAEFVSKLQSVTPEFKYHFLICGGALAVENALKTAFDWKAQQLKIDPNDEEAIRRLDVIHMREAFHGRSGYTLSLTNKPHDNLKTKFFPKFPWTRITNPKIHGDYDSLEKLEEAEEFSLDEAEVALKRGNVAAVIIEPIQGEGGDNHFREEYLIKLRRLVSEYESMLIFDEVQTGVGLTGKMWAYEHFEILPDMLCFGKKMQVCGFACSRKIDLVEKNVFKCGSRINSTWGGNIVDMARASIYLDIIKEDKLVENAAEVGKYFLDRLNELGLRNVRGRGFMLAFDLETTEQRNKVLNTLRENVLALPSGSKSIRFRPHLTFTKADVDIAIGFISCAI